MGKDKAINPKSQKTALLILVLIVFFDLLGFGILIPIVPFLLTTPNSVFFILPHGTPLSEGYILLGLLVAVYPLMGFFSNPILGQLSDKWGRKKLLTISVLGTLIGYILFAIGIAVANVPLLFFARILDGITGGSVSIARAAISDITDPDSRAKNYGLMNAGYGLGFIFGPFLGGVLSNSSLISWFNASTPFYFAALLSFMELLLVIYFLPETLKTKAKEFRFKLTQSISNIVQVFTHRNLRGILGAIFLYQAGFAFFFSFQAVYYISRFSFNQVWVGYMFAYIGICFGINQAFMIRKLDSVKEYKILVTGLIGTGLMIIVQIFPTAPWQLLIMIPVAVYFNGIPQAYLTAFLSRLANKSIQGQVMGINSSVSALALTVAPIMAGYLAAAFLPDAALYAGGFIVVLSGIIFWRFCKSAKHIEKL